MTAPYYQGDGVTLYHGDCLQITEWLAADVLVTDPPYGIGWQRRMNNRRASKPHAGIANDADTSARDRALELWGEEWPAIVFGSFYAPPPQGIRHWCVWEKPGDSGVVGSTVGLRRDIEAVWLIGGWPKRSAARGSVLRSNIRNSGNPSSPAGRTGHPHAKPLDLMAQLIDMCPPGVIADPFAGSGSPPATKAAKPSASRSKNATARLRHAAYPKES